MHARSWMDGCKHASMWQMNEIKMPITYEKNEIHTNENEMNRTHCRNRDDDDYGDMFLFLACSLSLFA